MCDPFYIFMLLHHLGRDYIVWDIATEITFKRASKLPATVTFRITPEKVAEIKALADSQYKVEPIFENVITDSQGQELAHVKKKLYVRRKDRKKA